MKQMLALYDVRGIQDYIFRTSKVKEAVGASKVIENIYEDALAFAVNTYNKDKPGNQITYDCKWFDEGGVKAYEPNTADIQTIYIGGGNASVIFASEPLAVDITKLMSEYVIRKTYSLQLAAAYVPKTDSYSKDYHALQAKMIEVKDSMRMTRPLGALPVMKIELQTGYPLSSLSKSSMEAKVLPTDKSKETGMKYIEGWEVRRQKEESARLLDNYITQKGKDSTLAVVHIDGNSMGARISELIRDISDYSEAVNRMRAISYAINQSFKRTYREMEEYFNDVAGSNPVFGEKKLKNHFVAGILVAGDDITYVCNGKVAFSTVKFFTEKINSLGMYGGHSKEDLHKYGFSVCAGIAFMNSHFPFNIGYEVAEACCGMAKTEAKKADNRDGDRIGNWVDFQICKNIQAVNLKKVREKEYVTPEGENLIIRPYYIPVVQEEGQGASTLLTGSSKDFNVFCWKMDQLSNTEKIPGSLVKELRNTYPLGQHQIALLKSFIDSRGWVLPKVTGEDGLYCEGTGTASLYDALEFMDDYVDVLGSKGGEEDEMSDKNQTAQ